MSLIIALQQERKHIYSSHAQSEEHLCYHRSGVICFLIQFFLVPCVERW